MKLLMSMLMAILLCGASALAGSAQDAPPSPATRPATQPATQPATAPAEQTMTPKEERTAMIAKIRSEMNLPEQNDTGWGSPNWFMPQSASETAPSTDGVLAYINIVTVVFTVLILGLMIFFAIYYRSRSPDQPDPEGVATHSTTLELTWTVIPTCIVLVMFALGFRDFLDQAVPPPNAMRINVHARMWSWQFTYPDGTITGDLHLPKDQPVQFILTSEDVIHSFFVPAFRIKKDVVPGRFNNIWVKATDEGIFDLYCTEYCGTGHSDMVTKCFVYGDDKFEEALAWLGDIYTDPLTGKPRSPEQVGRALWQQRACIGCHSVDGSVQLAPTWRNLWGAPRTFTDGTTRVADEAYIRQSILQPHTQLVQGYGATMPSFAGQLDDRDINSIIAYIQSLSDEYKASQQTGEVVGPGQSQSIPQNEPRRPGGGQQR